MNAPDRALDRALDRDGDLDTDDGEVILRDQQAPSSQLTSMLPNAGTGYTMQHTGIMLAGAGNITVLPKGGATLQRMLCISMVGRARVTDTPELEAFYEELAARNAGAFWKRANAIEPWEPETRYRPTLWRYADMRAMCLRALDLVKPEEAGRRVVTLLNDSDWRMGWQ